MIANTRAIHKGYGPDAGMIGDQFKNIVPRYPPLDVIKYFTNRLK